MMSAAAPTVFITHEVAALRAVIEEARRRNGLNYRADLVTAC
jgi:hypothetical protein